MIYRLCVLVDFDLEAWVCIFPHFLRSNPDTFKDLFQEGTLAAFSAFFVPLPAVVIQGKAYDDTRFTLCKGLFVQNTLLRLLRPLQ